ncbi:hypothetical protein [Halopenitus persicus]|uniref:hypothetical protein n=1 Tax=Halopenitus persicus TaxID=1048396 RepID=UPI000BBAE8C9|nr:hypothetical protein [Halopenitus persicus]
MLRRLDVAIADRVLPWRGSDVDLYPVGARVVSSSGEEYEIRSRAYDFDEGKVWYLMEGGDGDYERAIHASVETKTVIIPGETDSRTSAGDGRE